MVATLDMTAQPCHKHETDALQMLAELNVTAQQSLQYVALSLVDLPEMFPVALCVHVAVASPKMPFICLPS